MDSIGPMFRNLRGRGPSNAENRTSSLASAATSALFQEKVQDLEMELSRKRPRSEDDPFFEKTARTEKTETPVNMDSLAAVSASVSVSASAGVLGSGLVLSRTLSGVHFIRDHNLRLPVSRERTPTTDSFTPLDLKGGQLDKSSSRIAKRGTDKNTLYLPPGMLLHQVHGSNNAPDTVSGTDDHTQEDHDDVALEVLEEMHKLEECFPFLADRYRLLDKIGEGTFSTVYKAEAIDGAVMLGSQLWKSPPLKQISAVQARKKQKKNALVALKQIYVTSSPNRIHNELNLLFMLSGNSHVAPLLDILRYQDQVLAILPYYQHADFRDFYRDIPVKGIKNYMWELLQGLEFMHSKGIIHRDLKPTNFLYDPFNGKGVLVDFGLAEKMSPQQPVSMSSPASPAANACPCLLKDRSALPTSYLKRLNIKAAYPKVDQRPPRRANRAGTRGFRAPEVLFKCTNQSTKIDIWSAGIIGLSLLGRKFPLFNSPDDIDALMEIIFLFGVEKMLKCAELHGCGLELNLPTVQMSLFNGNLVKFLVTVLFYELESDALPADSVVHDTLKFLDRETDTLIKPIFDESGDATSETHAEHESIVDKYSDLKHLLQMLYSCLSMDPIKRLSASELLKMPFFLELSANEDDEVLL